MKLDKIFSIFKTNSVAHKNSTSTPQEANEAPTLPSLDMAFDVTRDLLAAQLERVDGLDAKANFALGAATALVSAALLLQSLLLPLRTHTSCAALVPGFLLALPPLLKRDLPLLPLLIAYLCAIITACFAYRVRDYKQVPTPRTLLDRYLDQSKQRTKAMLLRAMVEAYEGNEQEMKRKTGWIDRAFVALVIEAMLLCCSCCSFSTSSYVDRYA